MGGDLTPEQEGSFSGSTSTQAIDLELNALSSMGGDVSITIKQFGGSPCGLTALGFVPGDLTVDFDDGGVAIQAAHGWSGTSTWVAWAALGCPATS